jgi:hypothetical protein
VTRGAAAAVLQTRTVAVNANVPARIIAAVLSRLLFLAELGRTIWIVDAHRGDGKRFVVRADEKLTAFLELERITRESFRTNSHHPFNVMA